MSAGLPWQDGREPRVAFPIREFLARDAPRVARDLLGTLLVSRVGGEDCTAVIVETEAYLGPEDPASHAATRSGPTERNRAMFGPSGRVYVYRSYGVHWCLNVVTGRPGQGQAVLIRGVEILGGTATARARRGGRSPLGAGPGRAAQALGVTDELYGHDLTRPPLVLRPGWAVPDAHVEVTGRVGVTKAPEWPLRFLVRGSPGVTRVRAHPGLPELPSRLER